MVDGTYLKVVSSGDAGICKVYGLQVTQIVAVKRLRGRGHYSLWLVHKSKNSTAWKRQFPHKFKKKMPNDYILELQIVIWQKNDAHFFCPIAKSISRLSIDKFSVLTLFCDSWHEP